MHTRTLHMPTHRVGLKIEIHEIHQNLRNPVSINRPKVSEICLY